MADVDSKRQFGSGDRVALVGTVRYDRAGFVTVRWDDKTESVVWGADLVPEAKETER